MFYCIDLYNVYIKRLFTLHTYVLYLFSMACFHLFPNSDWNGFQWKQDVCGIDAKAWSHPETESSACGESRRPPFTLLRYRPHTYTGKHLTSDEIFLCVEPDSEQNVACFSSHVNRTSDKCFKLYHCRWAWLTLLFLWWSQLGLCLLTLARPLMESPEPQ